MTGPTIHDQAAPEALRQRLQEALDEGKALDVRVLEISNLTTIADWMIIATGRSDRHVKALADALLEAGREVGWRPLGVEGVRQGEWVLVDFQDVIVHVMQSAMREFYNLEKLWDLPVARGMARHR